MKKYLVGGAVRDILLGKEPKDRDWVLVGATNEDVQQLMDEGYTQVGADFPVLLHPQTKEEYALARVERKEGVGYHGFSVRADASVTIEEDLARRDLTINSMALCDDVLVDPYGGAWDLTNKILRHTSKAFSEDPLRVLRLARFKARLPDFTIAEETVVLARSLAAGGELNDLSIERVWVELEKGFSEDMVVYFLEALEHLGALEHCTVLRAMFGKLSPWQFISCNHLNFIEDQELKFTVGIAVLSHLGGGEIYGGTSRMKQLVKNLDLLKVTKCTAQDICSLLQKAGVMREGTSFHDFMHAVAVFESVKHDIFEVSYALIQKARREYVQIKSTDFPGVEGRELGVAIEKARVEQVARVLNPSSN